jgi:hypothetical protein
MPIQQPRPRRGPWRRSTIGSYGTAFILLFVVLLVVTVAAIAHNAYSRAAGAVLELSRKVIAETSEKIVDRTVNIFETARNQVSIDAAVVQGRDILGQSDVLLRLFWRQLDLTSEAISIYAATRPLAATSSRLWWLRAWPPG